MGFPSSHFAAQPYGSPSPPPPHGGPDSVPCSRSAPFGFSRLYSAILGSIRLLSTLPVTVQPLPPPLSSTNHRSRPFGSAHTRLLPAPLVSPRVSPRLSPPTALQFHQSPFPSLWLHQSALLSARLLPPPFGSSRHHPPPLLAPPWRPCAASRCRGAPDPAMGGRGGGEPELAPRHPINPIPLSREWWLW